MTHPDAIEEAEYQFGPRLWDADPDVCCAAFQLGACSHTEAAIADMQAEADALAYLGDLLYSEGAAMLAPVAGPPAPLVEEPF